MRILVITDRIPYPTTSGLPLRTYNLLRRIGRQHQVWLAAFTETTDEVEGVSHMYEFCQGVETVDTQQLSALARPVDFFRCLLMGIPTDLRLYQSEALIRKVQHLVSRVNFDIVEVVDSYMAMYLQALPSKIHSRTILTFIDIDFRKYDRISRLEPKPTRKLRVWLRSRMMRRWEPRYAERFGRCITVSEVDRRLLMAANPRLQIDVVPNGVDAHLYQPLPYEDTTAALVFVGNMGYRPNVDAVFEVK